MISIDRWILGGVRTNLGRTLQSVYSIKKRIEIEAWDYRAQVLYALMALFTGNIISSVLRFMKMANEEMQIIKSYNLMGWI